MICGKLPLKNALFLAAFFLATFFLATFFLEGCSLVFEGLVRLFS